MNWTIYILKCENNSLYTGITNNFNKRLKAHLDGRGAKYTRAFKPIKVEITFTVSDKSSALKIESYIKKKAALKKLQLINFPEEFLKEIKNSFNIEIELQNFLTENF